jgi:hypothetical protein
MQGLLECEVALWLIDGLERCAHKTHEELIGHDEHQYVCVCVCMCMSMQMYIYIQYV